MEYVMPEVNAILTLVLMVLGVLGSVAFIKVIRPAIERNDFYQRYRVVLDALEEVITVTVLRLAFSHEDLSDFEEDAKRTGRDVRLVAAIYLVDKFTKQFNIEIDEEHIVSRIEARLELLKQEGIIPRASAGETVQPPPFNPAAPSARR